MAVCNEEIVANQSSGHGVYSPAWNLRRRFPAEDGKHLVLQEFAPVQSTMTDTGMQQHECVYVSMLEEYNGPRKAGHIMHIMHVMHIMHITHILMAFVSHLSLGGLISILNHLRVQGTSTSVVSAPYWDVFQLFQWVRKGLYPMTCEENHQTFLELCVTKVRTVAMDVGGGT